MRSTKPDWNPVSTRRPHTRSVGTSGSTCPRCIGSQLQPDSFSGTPCVLPSAEAALKGARVLAPGWRHSSGAGRRRSARRRRLRYRTSAVHSSYSRPEPCWLGPGARLVHGPVAGKNAIHNYRIDGGSTCGLSGSTRRAPYRTVGRTRSARTVKQTAPCRDPHSWTGQGIVRPAPVRSSGRPESLTSTAKDLAEGSGRREAPRAPADHRVAASVEPPPLHTRRSTRSQRGRAERGGACGRADTRGDSP